MTLLRRIQDIAIDSRTDIGDVLRQCTVLAARLNNGPLKKWVGEELNGYGDEDELPPYRVLKGLHSTGTFFGPMGESFRNIPLPLSNVPEEYRDAVSQAELRQGVSSLASLVKSESDNLGLQWSADLIVLVSRKFMPGRTLIAATIAIPRNAIIDVLDSVRNRVLNFALEIEAESPTAGEGQAGSAPIAQERVSQVFHTTIMGGTNIAVGSAGVTQIGNLQAGDVDGLKVYLATFGVEPRDLDDLAVALRDDPQPEEGRGFGRKVSDWMGRMTAKAASGTWKIGLGAAGDLLAAAIRTYYGWSG